MEQSMKISAHQVRAALDAYINARRAGTKRSASAPESALRSMAVDSFQRRIDDMPEVRDLLVRDLRSQVLCGRYHIPSDEIVDALLGRLTADLLDQE
jgi:hypothetical protein